MNLPLRLLDRVPREPVISVDGAFDAPGLNLSHWPGNRTPHALKHDLSTGVALNFARLPAREREELARGCVAIVNNHYDTDGACAMFAVRHPELALAREAALLDAAWAGDFFRFPSARAFAIDAIVDGAADPERSPWRDRFTGLEERARREAALVAIVDALPRLLDGDLEPYAALWKAPLERAEADRGDVRAARRDEVLHLDLCVITSEGRGRGAQSDAFDPGRHALFGSSTCDRILVVAPEGAGFRYRFLIGTASWFDLVSRTVPPRPDLAALAEELNRAEGTRADAPIAWRSDAVETPSPELWFGAQDEELFREHAPMLATSALGPAKVRRALVDALRATWVFPDV